VHWGHLEDRPGERAHDLLQFLVVEIRYTGFLYCAFGIACRTDKPNRITAS